VVHTMMGAFATVALACYVALAHVVAFGVRLTWR
jgi:hypothetical protein